MFLTQKFNQNAVKEYPGIRDVLDTNLCILFSMEDQNIRSVLAQALVALCACIVFAICIVLAAIAILFHRKHWISANTFRIHKQFIMALLLQARYS